MATPQRNQNASVRIVFVTNKDNKIFNEHPEWRELLEKAFVGHEEVKVHSRLAGYSIAQTWRVSIDPKSFYVVKFGPPERLAQEYKNFKGKVSGNKLYGNPVTPEGPFAPDDKPLTSDNGQWAILKWTLAGGSHSQTLSDHIKGNYEEIGTYMGDILTHIFGADSRLKNPDLLKIAYAIHYDRLLPEHFSFEGQIITGEAPNAITLAAGNIARDDIPDLEAKLLTDRRPIVRLEKFRIEKIRNDEVMLYAEPPSGVDSPPIRVRYKLAPGQTLSSDQPAFLFAMHPQSRNEILAEYAREVLNKRRVKEKSFDYQGINYANPLIYLQDILGKEDKLQDELKFATIHGDLNLQNILVARVNNQIQHWLIDFADTAKGPMVLDFQWLEVQVIIWMLAPEIRNAQLSPTVLLTIFRELHECREMPHHLNSQLETPYTILRQIRLHVRNYLSNPNQWAEYYRGLILALLGSLRFRRSVPELDDYAPRVAFLSAAILTRFKGVVLYETEGFSMNLAPTIDESSLPALILPGASFVLRGSACGTGATIQVLANEKMLNSTKVDGRRAWQTRINFDKAGSYTLIVRDDISATESKVISVKVAEPLPPRPPKIDSLSAEPIYIGKSLRLGGEAPPGSTLKVFSNDNFMLETTTDESGRWHVELLPFAQAGNYTIYVKDIITGLASEPLTFTVIAPPTIDKASIPPQVFVGKKFNLQGSAQPNVQIKLIANHQTLAAPLVNSAGRWQAETVVKTPGTYHLLVRDESNKVESMPLSIPVLKPSPIIPKGVWAWSSLLVITLLLTFATLFTDQTMQSVGYAYNQIASWISSFDPPPPPPIVPPVACNPDLPKVKIGIAINQSGDYAIFRKDQKIAYEVAEVYFNKNGGIKGRCIELIDDKDLASETTNPDRIASAFQTLNEEDDVVAIIGPGLSQQAALIRKLLRDIKTLVLGASITRLNLVCDNEYFGRVSASGQWYIHLTLELARSRTTKNQPRVAIAFADDDEFAIGESGIFTNHITSKPGSYILLEEDKYRYKINTEGRNLDQDLAEIAGRIKSADPDMVIISGLTADGRILIRELRKAGYDKPIVGGNGLNTPYIFDDCEDCADFKNFFVPQAYSYKGAEKDTAPQIQRDFIDEYNNYKGEVKKPIYVSEPGQFAAQMFTAVQMIVESLRELSIEDADLSQEDRLAALREKLKSKLFSDSNPRDTVLGKLYLNAEGEVMQSQFYAAESIRNTDKPGYHFDIVNQLNIDPENAESACISN